MKFHTYIFWFGVFFGIPLGSYVCSIYKPSMYVIFAFLICSLIYPEWSITFFSREAYKTSTYGFEIHFADLCALVLFFAMLQRPNEFHLKYVIPLTIPYFCYLLISLVSWVFIDKNINLPFLLPPNNGPEYRYYQLGLYPLFEIFKILRGFFIMWVSANLFIDKKFIPVLIASFGLIIFYFTFSGLINRYIFHDMRITFGVFHPNIFNVYVGMLGAFLFPFVFATKKNWLVLIYLFLGMCALLCIILTVSRASLAGYMMSMFVVIILGSFKYKNYRNVLLVGAIIAISFLMLVKASGTLMERFNQEETQGGFDLRDKLNAAAVLMAQDHFFGVGLGNYYAWSVSKYAVLAESGENIAHNIWYLTLGELGFLGLAIFIFIWLRFYQMILYCLRLSRFQKGYDAFLLVSGILAASTVLQFQNYFHFAYRETSIFFTMQILTGLLIRIYLDIKRDRMIANAKQRT